MKIANNIRWFAAQEGAVLLNPRSSQYYHLNECGTTTWRAIAEGKSESDIIEALAREYNMPTEGIKKDLATFYDRLHSLGFLVPGLAEDNSVPPA